MLPFPGELEAICESLLPGAGAATSAAQTVRCTSPQFPLASAFTLTCSRNQAPTLCINKERRRRDDPGAAPTSPLAPLAHHQTPGAPGPAPASSRLARCSLPWPGISDDRRSCRLQEGETQKESFSREV